MNNMGCDVTRDDRYILIAGGIDTPPPRLRQIEYNDIFVLDLNTMEFKESGIKLPFEGGNCHTLIMENKKENDLLVHGFVRDISKKCNLNISFALKTGIAVFHPREYVHILDRNGSHWKINLEEILESIIM